MSILPRKEEDRLTTYRVGQTVLLRNGVVPWRIERIFPSGLAVVSQDRNGSIHYRTVNQVWRARPVKDYT